MLRFRWLMAVAASCVAVLGVSLVVPAAQGAAPVSTSVSLSAPVSAVYGSTIRLSGSVWRTGDSSERVTGATVVLQRSVHGTGRFRDLSSSRTTSTGSFTFSVKQASAYDYRVSFEGTATYRAAHSPTRYPAVRQKLVLESIETTDAETGQLTATGRVYPTPPAGTVVHLQRLGADPKAWVNQATGTTSGNRVTIDAIRPGSVGSYRLRIKARQQWGTGTSAVEDFTHYVWRDALTKGVRSVRSDADHVTVDDFADDQHPGRRALVVRAYGDPGSVVELGLTIGGCVEARHQTRNYFGIGTEDLPAQVQLATDLISGAGVDLPRDTDEVGSSLDLKNATHLWYRAQMRGTRDTVGFWLQVRAQLRCAN